MQSMQHTIQAWCASGSLPDAATVYNTFTDSGGLFVRQEGPCWDFKDEWPFSLSDEYFGGIARLICAFTNTYGGVIVFGVHDEFRTGGHNKVRINFDRFQSAVTQLLGEPLPLAMRSYSSDRYGAIDVLLVPPRTRATPPLRFLSKVGKYRANAIWVRSGHEVVEASPRHFPILFCRVDASAPDDTNTQLGGRLPPSPATLRRFVGRVHVMDQLFRWLQTSDEPRTYLYGKGGSGKSTIAFEFARLLKNHGSSVSIYSGDTIDSVIYVTAKDQMLSTSSELTVMASDPDFTTERELYIKILLHGRWILDENALFDMNLEQLRHEIHEFFNYSSNVLIIDDIDTLTTKGIDAGSDFLYRVLCKANQPSKILYTLRNAPSQSISNSIEVPGLLNEEYPDFVKECARHFRVPEPDQLTRDGPLSNLSERRPLVVESIIALVRTCGSYKRAIEAFEQQASGENVRDYVFKREWDSLRGNSLARLLLAALADLNQATSFEDLGAVLQAQPSRISDAIGAVREMFLQLDQTTNDTLYLLAPLTRQFVQEQKVTLPQYDVLRERIKQYRRTITVASPAVAREVQAVERLLPPRQPSHSVEKLEDAWRRVTNENLQPNVTEDPIFRSLYGYVAASCGHLVEAREAFEYATRMRAEPEFRYLLTWFFAERNSGTYDDWCERVADIVISGKRYSESEKIQMMSRKATSLFARARAIEYTDHIDAMRLFEEALLLHLRAFRLNCHNGSAWVDKSEEYSRNTSYIIFSNLSRSESPWSVLGSFRDILSCEELYFDPIEDPFRQTIMALMDKKWGRDVLNRFRQKLRGLPEMAEDSSRWLDSSCGKRIGELLRKIDRDLSVRLRLG